MAKQRLATTALALFSAATLSSLYTSAEAANGTTPGCPTQFGCVCVSPSDVTCDGSTTTLPAAVTLNLADMGFQEVPVFEGVYENVRVIDLGSNFITTIHESSFTSTHFPRLEEIILMDNAVSRVDIGAFEVTTLEILDLSDNQLEEFTVGSFTRVTGPGFNMLHLEDNRIQTVNGVTRERFTREFFPLFSIYLSGNAPPCEGEFFIRLCPFLEDASATLCAVATPEGTEFLTLRDVCNDLPPPDYMYTFSGDMAGESDPEVDVIVGGAIGGVLGVLLIILLAVLLVVCWRLKMWEKKFNSVVQSTQPKPLEFVQKPVPPSRPPVSPRYTNSPGHQCRVGSGAADGPESVYEDLDFSSRPLPDIPSEELYYDSDGYILRIDSVPLRPGESPKQGTAVAGIIPQNYEEPVTTLKRKRQSEEGETGKDEKHERSNEGAEKGKVVSNTGDDKEREGKAEEGGAEETPTTAGNQDSVYLQMVV